MAKAGIKISIKEGTTLRQILKEQKLEQSVLALSTDISESQISNFLSGWTGMSPDRVQSVYDVLKWDQRARFLHKYLVKYQREHPDILPVDFEMRIAQMRKSYDHQPPEDQKAIIAQMDVILQRYRPPSSPEGLQKLLKKLG